MEQLAFMSMKSKIGQKIQNRWSKYPEANINISEILRRNEIPKWEDCKKNELWIGIIRQSKGDLVHIVRHQMEGAFQLSISFEQLTDKHLSYIGAYPQNNHYCKECGEFSTRIDHDGRCSDCNDKKEQKKETL